MKYDVVALGELLIDFTSGGLSENQVPVFEANPGGAPCNVLAMLSKLGKRTSFIGKVGDDIFGRQLHDTIVALRIDASGLITDERVNTTLAFVKNAPDGDREFSFFRKPGADTMLCSDELNRAILNNARIFHFGSLSLSDEPSRNATCHAVQLAKNSGALISFDPNLRAPLWGSLDEAHRQISWGCEVCDILKVAEDELAFLTGCSNLDEGAAKLRARHPQIQILFVTKGSDGAECFYKGLHVAQPAYLSQKSIDTTGAGDTFLGCCLAFLLDNGLEKLSEPQIGQMLSYANAAAAFVTTKKGAIRSMPKHVEILHVMTDL